MTSKIIRADGTTELASIKTVTYHESVNADTDLRPGCVASNYIEVTCFGAQTDAPDVGEALTYYQVVGETETLIGVFYAEPSIPTKNSYSFVAYDAVHKLDADFSSWLSANQDDFPYTVYQLVSQACTIAGVTLGTSSWDHSTMEVNAWYADGLTCRNILQYAAEIACKFVRCNTSGQIVFDWYKGAASGETKTASGAIATFPDGADGLPLKKLVAQIDPGQDLHGYDSPWPAGGGKNLCPKFSQVSQSGITVDVADDGTLTINGTATATVNMIITGLNIPAGTYTFSLNNQTTVGTSAADTIYAFARNTNNAWVMNPLARIANAVGTGTTEYPINAVVIVINSGVSVSNFIIKPQLESGSTATAFAPYSNICPISGWTGLEGKRTGVNVWDEETEIGRLDTNTGADYPSSAQLRTKNYVPVIGGKTYYFGTPTLTGSGQGMWILFYDDSKSVISGYTPPESVDKYQNAFRPQNKAMTVPTNAKYLRFYLTPEYGTTYVGNIFINYPSTDHDYHAYSGESLSVNWQDTAGTVYGGSMTVNEDGSGVLTATVAGVDLGSLNWEQHPTYSQCFYINAATLGLKSPTSVGRWGMCSTYPCIFNVSINITKIETTSDSVFVAPAAWSSANPFIVVNDPSYNTASDFKNAMNGVRLLYELATPQTYHFDNLEQLSTVYGINNIWVDTGDVSVEYYPTLGRIYPSSGTDESGDRFAYKQDGLTYDNYDTSALARVAVHPVGEDDVAYYYPADVQSGNTLDITNNALLYGASAEDMSGIAQSIHTTMTALGTYRPMRVNMFPNECPFKAGQIVPVTDAQGVSFNTIIMGKTVTDSEVTLSSTGREVYGDYAMDTAKKLIQLAADIVRINKLKVDWAEIDQIFARDITVTGQLHSADYSHTSGEIYANAGMGMDFGDKIINTPNFGITSNGNLYARGGRIADFNLARSVAAVYYPNAGYIHWYNTSGTETSNYELVPPYNTVLAHEDGSATFRPSSKSVVISGQTVMLSKLWIQCVSGGNYSEERPTPQGTITYYRSDNTVLYRQYLETLRYFESGSNIGNAYVINTQYLNSASYLVLQVDLANGDSCKVYMNYGTSSSLYTDSPKLGDSDNGIYLGTDGFSAGRDVILTPDGRGQFGDVETDNLYVDADANFGGRVFLTGSDLDSTVRPASNSINRRIYFRDMNKKVDARIQDVFFANGNIGIQIIADRMVNGTRYLNTLGLFESEAGAGSVSLSHPDAWMSALSASTTEQTTTISDIATAGTDITIGSAYYSHWGKVAMLRVQMTSTEAQAAGSKTVATIASGKRPIQQVGVVASTGSACYLNANGQLLYSGALTANQTITVLCTYILA